MKIVSGENLPYIGCAKKTREAYEYQVDCGTVTARVAKEEWSRRGSPKCRTRGLSAVGLWPLGPGPDIGS